VNALSNDVNRLSNCLKPVTRQCSEPDLEKVLGQRFYSRDDQEIWHLDRIRKGIDGAQLHGRREADLRAILQTSLNPSFAL
jgi:hypothetical protein